MRETPAGKRVSQPWHVFVSFFWLLVAVGASVLLVFEIVDEEEPLSAIGALFVVLILICLFIILRRIVAVWGAQVTNGQVLAYDLWRGERMFLVGIAAVYPPALVSRYFLRVDFVPLTGDLFSVIAAIVIIAPLSHWMGDNRLAVWKLFKARMDQTYLGNKPAIPAALRPAETDSVLRSVALTEANGRTPT